MIKARKELMKRIKDSIFLLKYASKLCFKRVIFTGVFHGLHYAEWIFFSTVFMKILIYRLEIRTRYIDILLFIFTTSLVLFFIQLYNSLYENIIKPITDTVIYEKIYKQLYQKAQLADLSCFENSDFYNNYMLILENADTRIIDTIDNLWAIIMGGVAVIISWYIMIKTDKYIVFFVLAPIIGNFIFGTLLNKINYNINMESIIYKRVVDYVKRIFKLSDYAEDIRMTNLKEIINEKHKTAFASIYKIIDKYKRKICIFGWFSLMLTYTSMFEGVLFYGVYRTMITKSMTFSELTILSGLMVTVSSILIEFSTAVLSNYKNSLFVESLRKFLMFKPTISEDIDGCIPSKSIETIEFCNVSFQYPHGKKILNNVSFKFCKGNTYALVGMNGVGKSTIIKLMLRLYDPTEGTILVNHIDIKEYNLQEYRKLFSTAFQDGIIFARNISDNIWMDEIDYNNKEIIENDIWNSLDQVGLKDYVKNLPNQLNTMLTKEFCKEGVNLSEGQKQKLLVARAFVKNREVVILDEPSSALDPIAEFQLFSCIDKKKDNKIILFISHRLSSVRGAKEILLIQNGMIIERGTHDELINLKGKYQEMFEVQAKKYISVV